MPSVAPQCAPTSGRDCPLPEAALVARAAMRRTAAAVAGGLLAAGRAPRTRHEFGAPAGPGAPALALTEYGSRGGLEPGRRQHSPARQSLAHVHGACDCEFLQLLVICVCHCEGWCLAALLPCFAAACGCAQTAAIFSCPEELCVVATFQPQPVVAIGTLRLAKSDFIFGTCVFSLVRSDLRW